MSEPDQSRDALRALVPALTSAVPDIVAEVVELLRDDWPDYAAALDADAEDIHRTAEVALLHLVRLAEQVPAGGYRVLATDELAPGSVFEEAGRLEWRQGRQLGGLLTAYRSGARVAWRHLSRAAVELRLDPATMSALAEAVFVFVDELSSASARGYVDEQRATGAERERLRGQLGEHLISTPTDPSTLRALAAQAGWPLPARAALAVLHTESAEGTTVLDRVADRALLVRSHGLPGLVVSDPDGPGRRAAIEQALGGCGAVVGTPAPPHELVATVETVHVAARLARTGVLPDDPLFVADHYDTTLVARDPWLLDRLREQVLAPTAGLPATTQRRLLATLEAWLAAMGDRQATAEQLGIHPQTVRYRMRQLADLFGDALTDPRKRLMLTLALCWPTDPCDPALEAASPRP
jgi:hypothetical protein